MSRRVSKIITTCAYASVFIFISVLSTGVETVESTVKNSTELARMKAVIDCTCKCGLTLVHCEKEDSSCSQRPALLVKLNRLIDEGRRGMELVTAFMYPLHPVKKQLMEARLEKRHAILFFSQQGSAKSDAVEAVLEKAANVWGRRVTIARVDIYKRENAMIRQEYGIYSAPIVLVIGPNGVVTRQFKEDITMANLESAFVTPATARIMRGLQDKRVIFLTVQAPDWENASSVKKTVQGVGDILRNSVRIVHIDPSDQEEKPLLKLLNADINQNRSMAFVVSQSGQIGSRFEGPVSRKDLFLAFQKVLSARSGCGVSGSGPGGNTCK